MGTPFHEGDVAPIPRRTFVTLARIGVSNPGTRQHVRENADRGLDSPTISGLNSLARLWQSAHREEAPLPVDQLLKKNFWIVLLPLIAIAAFLNAKSVTQLVGIGVMPDEKQLSVPPAVAKTPPQAFSVGRNPSAEPILSRNPFDHVTGTLKPPPVDESAGAGTTPVDSTDPFSAPACDGVK